MEWYRFGPKEGRYVGEGRKFTIFARSITDRSEAGMPAAANAYRKLPGEFDFSYGPATGGMLEATGITISTPGELVKHLSVNPDFKKRSVSITRLPVKDALLKVERINGFHSGCHSIAFLSAVEDALGIHPPVEVLSARIAIVELERIRSNMEVIKRMCEAAGFAVPANQLGYLREETSRVISEASGHRFFFGVNGISGMKADFRHLGAGLDAIGKQFSRIFDGLLESKIFLNRLQNNGIISTQDIVGPAARACGSATDARLDSRTLPYGGLRFRPVINSDRDSFARFMVRGQEILQSVDLVSQLDFDAIPEPAEVDAAWSGEGAARLESPQGDLFYYVKLGDGGIQDMMMVSPSRSNIRAFEESMKGNNFADFHFNWESFGIWISEIGVDIV